jgi:hypothetical protein
MELSLEFKDNNSGHDDLVLSFEGETLVGDSYYFALDRNLMPDREDSVKVRAVLKKLLQQWLEAVKQGSELGITYLPYAFFDEYTCWLKCSYKNNNVYVCNGWAEIDGYSFFPSDISNYVQNIESFKETGPTKSMQVSQLVEAINESLSKIA